MNKKINLLLVSALFAAAQPLQAFAVVGKVEFSTAGVTAVSQSGATRALNKGAEIDVGDTIQTNDARAQLKFTDGGYVSLQPNTTFKVEEYAYADKKDGTDKSFFSLLKGGMRAITGLVGKTNKQAYRLNTPVATIGIRGTEFVAEYDNKLLVKVGEGAVYMANNGGDITLYAGQIGAVGDSNDKPELTDEEPSVGAKGPQGGESEEAQEQAEKESEQQNQFTESEQANQNGEAEIIANKIEKPEKEPTPELKPFNYTGSVGVAEYSEYGGSIDVETGNTLKFKANGDFLGYEGNSCECSHKEVKFTGNTVDKGHVGSGNDRLSWMRLTGGNFIATIDGYPPTTEANTNTHVIFGQITPASHMAALASGNYHATYNFAGGTKTTNASGATGHVTSGSLDVDFSYASVNLSMGLNNGGHNYSVSASGYTSGAKFYLNSGYATSSNCDGSCGFNGKGFFVGANAGKAALTYSIQGALGGDVVGVAGFVSNGNQNNVYTRTR